MTKQKLWEVQNRKEWKNKETWERGKEVEV